MSDKTGGPAYPIWTEDMPVVGGSGMTMRQYYKAAMARAWRAAEVGEPLDDRMSSKSLASLAAEDADALIAEDLAREASDEA